MELMKLGIMTTVNQNLDEETVIILGEILGLEVMIGKVSKESVEEGLELFEDKEEDTLYLVSKCPIILLMFC